MSVTMAALAYSDDSENELFGMGFKPMDVYLKYTDFPVSEEGVAQATCEVFSLHNDEIPYQFAVAPYWKSGNKEGVVLVALCIRTGTERILNLHGFRKIKVMGKCGHSGQTIEAIPKNEQEFLSMEFPPEKWYTSSYWGAGAS